VNDEIERLKAAMYEANRLAREACDRARSAREAFEAALLAATGLVGHMVEYEKQAFRKTETVRFVVERLGRWNDYAVCGRMVKKDGSLGERIVECSVAHLKDLGPYEPPAGQR